MEDSDLVAGPPATSGPRGMYVRTIARQLGRPSGLFGRLVVARKLNQGNRNNVTAAVDALEPVAGAAVADIGFGGGIGLGLLLAKVGETGRVHGVDISTAMLSAAGRRYRADSDRLRLHAGSITALPLPDASVDGAICVNIIYFVDDLDLAFAELARVLRPSGRLVLGIANPPTMAKVPFVAYGFRLRPVEGIIERLAKAGLPVVEHRRVGEGDSAYHLLVAQRNPA